MLAPEGILCSETNEYILKDTDNNYIIGLTEHAVQQLGDIVFVELPETDTVFSKGDVFATVESVKTAAELYLPVDGKVIAVNEKVIENPDLLNDSPYEEGWLIKIKCEESTIGFEDLLEFDDYLERIEEI